MEFFIPLLLLLGVAGGAISTVAGMGGGMLLVLVLSLVEDPLTALTMTAPALLLANGHRLWLFRTSVDRRVAGSFVLGAFPGALVGSLITVALPDGVLPWILLGVASIAVARALGWFTWTPSPKALTPAGFATGTLAATSGAGIFVSPILLAAGLRGEAYIATVASTAIAMHVARILGYGMGGVLHLSTLGSAGLLAIGLVAGNLVGRAVRRKIGDDRSLHVTYGVMGTLVLLALVGVS